MPDDRDERTEEATPRRREEARQKGNIAKSMELNYALVFLTGVMSVYFFIKHMFANIREVFIYYLTHLNYDLTVANAYALAFTLVKQMFVIVFPVLLALIVVSIFSNVAQFGFLMSSEALVPKFERINPISGLGRLFSMRGLVELLKSIVKIAIIGYVVYFTIKSGYEQYLMLSYAPVNTIIVFVLTVIYKVAIRAGIAMLVLAVFDFGYQRWQYEQDMKMTIQEIKEEYRNTEGDPLVKSRIRSIQREMARRRMMEEVPKADVVITNPTHYAVAIQYDPLTMSAPKVIAKGQRLIAQKIREIAEGNRIPLVENPPVARAIYASVDVGDEVPEEYYTVIAEILAYVYKLKNKKVGKV